MSKALHMISGSLRWDPAIAKVPVGTTAILTRSFTLDQVKAFADLAGDDNPIHQDPAYAATTRFKKPIVHGMLFSSLFGTIFGASIPGAIYLSQNLEFKKPVFVDETISAKIEVVAVREKPHIVTCKTTVVKTDGTIAVQGEAAVLLPGPVPAAGATTQQLK